MPEMKKLFAILLTLIPAAAAWSAPVADVQKTSGRDLQADSVALHPSHKTVPWLSPMRDIYVLTGVPLDRKITNESLDVKFQLSFKLYPFYVSPRWTCYFAYTHLTVWNAYGHSAPFRDNSYMPGFYFDGNLPHGNRLILGLEHRSNGRPYYGNPLASETVQDYSRGMNYIFASWRKTLGRHEFGLDAKAGVSCGVGPYPRGENRYTQDLFLYYLGYLTMDYRFNAERFGLHASVTPIVNSSIANVTAEASYKVVNNDKFPMRLMLQFHYGFDDAMCDCVQDAAPPVHLRFGFLFRK